MITKVSIRKTSFIPGFCLITLATFSTKVRNFMVLVLGLFWRRLQRVSSHWLLIQQEFRPLAVLVLGSFCHPLFSDVLDEEKNFGDDNIDDVCKRKNFEFWENFNKLQFNVKNVEGPFFIFCCIGLRMWTWLIFGANRI